MSATATPLPACRSDLVVRPVGDAGECVVKDPGSGEFFQLGPHEHFLLTQLDGRREAADVCAAFEQLFGHELAEDELNEFVAAIREQGLLGEPPGQQPAKRRGGRGTGERGQNLLYWRKSVFDPDRLFTRLEPRMRFFWTRGFLVLSAGCIALATVRGLGQPRTSGRQLSRRPALGDGRLGVADAVRRHAPARVRPRADVQALRRRGARGRLPVVLFFMPCFYCNVSDAWLFKEKSKRLWVTFAGGYFELFLWALAVFAWRLTVPGTFPNYLAFVVRHRVRRADAVQLQPAAEARRLLPALATGLACPT